MGFTWTCWKQHKSLLQMKSNWLFSDFVENNSRKLYWLSLNDVLMTLFQRRKQRWIWRWFFAFCCETKHHLWFDLLLNFHKMTLKFLSAPNTVKKKHKNFGAQHLSQAKCYVSISRVAHVLLQIEGNFVILMITQVIHAHTHMMYGNYDTP